MDLRERIDKIKTYHMKSLKRAVDLNSVDRMVLHTKVIEESEQLSRKLNLLEESLLILEKYIEPNINPETKIRPKKTTPNTGFLIVVGPSNKVKGDEKRKAFVQIAKDKGVSLVREKGVLYRTVSGNLVGIGYGSERINNRYFLGLPVNNYSSFILMCESSDGDLLPFIFPKKFFDNIKSLISVKNNQMKFNIAKRIDGFHLSIPRRGTVDISEYLNNFEALK